MSARAQVNIPSLRRSLDLNTSQSECYALNCSFASARIGGSCADYNVMSPFGKLGSKIAPQ